MKLLLRLSLASRVSSPPHSPGRCLTQPFKHLHARTFPKIHTRVNKKNHLSLHSLAGNRAPSPLARRRGPCGGDREAAGCTRRLHAQVARAGCTRWLQPWTSSLLPLLPLQRPPLPEELLARELQGGPRICRQQTNNNPGASRPRLLM